MVLNLEIINKIQQAASSYLTGKLSYFDGTHYAVKASGFSETKQPGAICIVARNHCVETKKSYSSISRKELQAILTLEKKNAAQPTCYRVMENAKQDAFEVHKTVFSVSAETLKNAWLLIPESFLLGTLYPKQLLSVETPNGTLYSYMSGSLHCLYQAGLIRSIEAFKHSVGLPDDVNDQTLTLSDYAKAIGQIGVNKSLLELLRASAVCTQGKVNANKLHALYIAPLVTLTLLLGGAVGMQLYQLNKNEAVALAASDEIKTILATSNNITQMSAVIAEVNEQILSKPLAYHHWQLLALLVEEEVKFNFLRYENNAVVVDGEVKNSGKMLAKLNQHPLVQSAQFTGAVSKSGDTDKFNLNITLN